MKQIAALLAGLALACACLAPTATAGPRGAAPTSCKTVDAAQTARSAWFHTTVYRFHLLARWCWQGPSITTATVSCYASDVDSLGFTYNGCTMVSSWYYRWGGSPKGGYFAEAQGSFSNCVLKVGCVGNHYPTLKIWLNAGGGWTTEPATKGASNGS